MNARRSVAIKELSHEAPSLSQAQRARARRRGRRLARHRRRRARRGQAGRARGRQAGGARDGQAGRGDRAAGVRHRAVDGSRSLGGDLRRGREAGAGRDVAQGARAGGVELAPVDGGAVRAAHSGRAGSRSSAGGSRRRRVWNPAAAVGAKVPAPGGRGDRFVRARGAVPPLPARDADIAFAPLTTLSRWLESSKLSSERLTHDLPRAARALPAAASVQHHPHARPGARAARRADAELARGKYRGPLHGVPWGAKDLLDTAGIADHLGRGAVPPSRAGDGRRGRAAAADAGAVLVAKLSLGALALNDVWFGGQTKNPWNLDEGSSGSSAGPGAATAAGLVGFAIGSRDARQHRLAVDCAVGWRACGRRSGGCRAPARWRCAGRSTSWGRWPAGSRTRCSCCARSRAPDAARSVERCRARCDFDGNGAGARAARRLRPGVDEGGAGDAASMPPRSSTCARRLTRRRGGAARLALRLAQPILFAEVGGVVRGADARRTASIG